ncbi:hypothetical protein BC828DRAFT_389959 [Blastocladiella britannica]|nr:hypothetical protein BC828DRAFT_389959 [Blastocladiella britannica]
MTTVIQLVQGVVGGFMPATNKIRVTLLIPSSPDSPAQLHAAVLTDRATKAYTTSTASIARTDAAALADRLRTRLASLPVEDGSDDLYRADTYLALVAGIPDESAALAALADGPARVYGFDAVAPTAAFVWATRPPQGCARFEGDVDVTDEHRASFWAAVAEIVDAVRGAAPTVAAAATVKTL